MFPAFEVTEERRQTASEGVTQRPLGESIHSIRWDVKGRDNAFRSLKINTDYNRQKPGSGRTQVEKISDPQRCERPWPTSELLQNAALPNI
jgi:hypothetical protein